MVGVSPFARIFLISFEAFSPLVGNLRKGCSSEDTTHLWVGQVKRDFLIVPRNFSMLCSPFLYILIIAFLLVLSILFYKKILLFSSSFWLCWSAFQIPFHGFWFQPCWAFLRVPRLFRRCKVSFFCPPYLYTYSIACFKIMSILFIKKNLTLQGDFLHVHWEVQPFLSAPQVLSDRFQ